jgi:3-isopropylmalate/(R)-2-methylmalate dehydratase small subunit
VGFRSPERKLTHWPLSADEGVRFRLAVPDSLCGSSHEQAATCVKASGVTAVVAVSFSRLFFRNAINEGLPVVELAGGTDAIKKGDTIGIDFEKGVVIHEGKEYHFPALPKGVLATLNDSGLIPHVKKLLAKA